MSKKYSNSLSLHQKPLVLSPSLAKNEVQTSEKFHTIFNNQKEKNLLKYLSGLFVKMFLVQTVVSLIFTKFTEDIKDLFLPWSNVNTA